MNIATYFAILSLFLTTKAWPSGGDRGHGGDPLLIDQAQIKLYIEQQLRNEVDATIQWILSVNQSQRHREFAATVLTLRDQGLIDEIAHSPFEFKSECIDYEGKQKGAVANDHEKLGPICWSVPFLASRKPTQSEIASLGFHEFIHHLGVEDRDHTLAAQFQELHLMRLSELAPHMVSATHFERSHWNRYSGSLSLDHSIKGKRVKKFKKLHYILITDSTTGYCEIELKNKQTFPCYLSTNEPLRLLKQTDEPKVSAFRAYYFAHARGYLNWRTFNVFITRATFQSLLESMGLPTEVQFTNLTDVISHINLLTIESGNPYIEGGYTAQIVTRNNDRELIDLRTRTPGHDYRVQIRVDN